RRRPRTNANGRTRVARANPAARITRIESATRIRCKRALRSSSFEPHARIDGREQEVREDVPREADQHVEDEDAHENGVIALEERRVREEPHARDVARLLYEERAREQDPEEPAEPDADRDH